MPSSQGYRKVDVNLSSPSSTVPATFSAAVGPQPGQERRHQYFGYAPVPREAGLEEESEDSSGFDQLSATAPSNPRMAVQPPSNNSSQLLVAETQSHSSQDADKMTTTTVSQEFGDSSNPHRITSLEWFTVFVLCFVNLINYMDRLTIAGMSKLRNKLRI